MAGTNQVFKWCVLNRSSPISLLLWVYGRLVISDFIGHLGVGTREGTTAVVTNSIHGFYMSWNTRFCPTELYFSLLVYQINYLFGVFIDVRYYSTVKICFSTKSQALNVLFNGSRNIIVRKNILWLWQDRYTTFTQVLLIKVQCFYKFSLYNLTTREHIIYLFRCYLVSTC